MSLPGFLPFKHRDWRGEVLESAHSDLDPLLALLDTNDPVRILKSGSSRKVWVGELPSGPLCVKEYSCPKIIDRLALALRGSRASREWIRLRRFFEAGVPVPQPILWAEGKDASGQKKSVILTRFIEGGATLDTALAESDCRWKILRATGRALANMHALGARHDDLHAGNLLIVGDVNEPEALIMDLHQVRLRKSLSWNSRLKNLATLSGGFQASLSEFEKHHALRGYLKSLPDWNPPFRTEREARYAMGRALESFGRTYFRKRCRDRIQKCTREGKRYQRISPGEYRGWIRREKSHPRLLEWMADPNRWIDSTDCVVLKHTPTTTVVRATYSDGQPPLFMKRYNRKDWWEKTKNLFRPSRAMKVWRAGYGLEIMGIPTPRVVAVLEKRTGLFLQESFILTEWTEGGVGLDDFWNQRAAPTSSNPISFEERKKLRRRVAGLFRSLHEMRISHGDLKGRNILLDINEPAPYDPKFVDLDAIQFSPIRFRRSRINDLSRLLFSVYPNVSALTQIRFFKDYCGQDRRIWKERRDWWKRIAKRTQRKLREKGLFQ